VCVPLRQSCSMMVGEGLCIDIRLFSLINWLILFVFYIDEATLFIFFLSKWFPCNYLCGSDETLFSFGKTFSTKARTILHI
jgi:hypothetical protein